MTELSPKAAHDSTHRLAPWSGTAVAWLAVVMAVGVALRMARIGSQPLWSDETATLIISKYSTFSLMAETVDPTPGLYYILHKWLIPDGSTLLAIRSISLIAGVLLIPVTGCFAWIVGGRRVAALAAALVALSPMMIDYSQEARTYSLLTLLIMISAIGLLLMLRDKASDDGTPVGAMAMFALGALGAFYAHYCSIFWIGPAVALLVVTIAGRPRARFSRLAAILLVIMAACATPGIIRLVESLNEGVDFAWLPHAIPAQFLATIGEEYLPTGRWTPNYLRMPDFIGVIAGVFLLQMVAIVLWTRAKRPGEGDQTAVLAIFAFAPIVVWLTGFFITPTFMPRTILWTVPGVLTILAGGVLELGGIPAAIGAILAYAVSLGFSGTMRAERQDTRPIIAIIRANARPGDVLLTCLPWRATELIAAADKPLAMPLLSWMNRRMAMLEPQLGADPDWAAHLGFTYGRPLARIEARPVFATGRAWFVASQCSPRYWARMNGWLGRGRWTLVRKDSATAVLPNDLWFFDPAEAPRVRNTVYRASN